MNCIIIADSGGSKTKIGVYDSAFRLLEEHRLPGFGTASDADTLIEPLDTFLASLAETYTPLLICANLGGRNSGQLFNTFAARFPRAHIEIVRESEGTAALAFGKSVGASAVLLAGTGTLVCARNEAENRFTIVGGWGQDIGDAGSGYDIGLLSVRVSLAALDGTSPLGLLERRITGRDKPFDTDMTAKDYLAARDAVRTKIGSRDRAHIASFSRVTAECAKAGDKTAADILRMAGEAAGKTLAATMKKCALHGKTAAVTGGLTAIPIWKKALEETVKKEAAAARVIFDADGIYAGVKALAKARMEEIGHDE